MSEGLRILVTGFGPFPGAPFNPTEPLVKRLTQLRRPALDRVAHCDLKHARQLFGHADELRRLVGSL